LLIASPLRDHHIEAFVAVIEGLGEEEAFRVATRDVHATQTNVEVNRRVKVVDVGAGSRA